MNKLIIYIPFLLLHFTLYSQITIDQTDMPEAGDTIRLSSAVDLGNLDFEETGSNFVWDFSELTFLSQRVDTFVSVQQTPWVYQLIFLLSSNLASPGQDFDQLPGFQVTDYFNYYKNSGSSFKSVGFGITLNGLPVPNKFDEPDIIYRFPLSAGDLDSSLSVYELNLPGIGYYGGWKKRVNLADGWGELTTPYGTFETIRIKSDIIQYDSLYIDSLGFGFPMLRNFTEYKWLGKDFGLPLCTVTDDGLLPVVEYIDSVRSVIAATPENIVKDNFISVDPNPFKQSLTIGFSRDIQSEVIVSLYDIRGEKVFEIAGHSTASGQKQILKLDNLLIPGGVYLLNIQIEGKRYLRKIIKR